MGGKPQSKWVSDDGVVSVRGDLRGSGWFWAHNQIVDEYASLIGDTGLAVYMLFARRWYNSGEKAIKLEQSVIAEHFHIDRTKIARSILLLEWCGLIYVKRHHRAASDIWLCPVEPLTPVVLEEIKLFVYSQTGGEFTKKPKHRQSRAYLLKNIERYKSLSDRITEKINAGIKTKPTEAEEMLEELARHRQQAIQAEQKTPRVTIDTPVEEQSATKEEKNWQLAIKFLKQQMTKGVHSRMKNAIKFISSENGHYVIEVKEDARDWIYFTR